MNYYWKRDEVLGKLDVHMTTIYIDISNIAQSRKMALREAAYLVAIDRVARACQERGWI
jgi:glutamate dehydrogenase (NAD(P)+)